MLDKDDLWGTYLLKLNLVNWILFFMNIVKFSASARSAGLRYQNKNTNIMNNISAERNRFQQYIYIFFNF